MAFQLAEAYVDINARNGNLMAGLGAARAALGGFVRSATSMLMRVAAPIAFTEFLRRSVKEAMDAETAQVKLRAALDQVTTDAAQEVAEFKRLASAMQEVTTIGDEQFLDLLRVGANLTRKHGAELATMAKAAIGLARIIDSDASAAMELLSKATMGNTAMLGRYGIKVDETQSKQEQLNTIMRRSLDAFSQETAIAGTSAGALKRLGDTVGDMMEEVGNAIGGGSFGNVVENFRKGLLFVAETAELTIGPTVQWIKDTWNSLVGSTRDALLVMVEFWGTLPESIIGGIRMAAEFAAGIFMVKIPGAVDAGMAIAVNAVESAVPHIAAAFEYAWERVKSGVAVTVAYLKMQWESLKFMLGQGSAEATVKAERDFKNTKAGGRSYDQIFGALSEGMAGRQQGRVDAAGGRKANAQRNLDRFFQGVFGDTQGAFREKLQAIRDKFNELFGGGDDAGGAGGPDVNVGAFGGGDSAGSSRGRGPKGIGIRVATGFERFGAGGDEAMKLQRQSNIYLRTIATNTGKSGGGAAA